MTVPLPFQHIVLRDMNGSVIRLVLLLSPKHQYADLRKKNMAYGLMSLSGININM